MNISYPELLVLMKALLKPLGSQAALARALKVSRALITHWLNGSRVPTYVHVLLMQKMLKQYQVVKNTKNNMHPFNKAFDIKTFAEEMEFKIDVNLSISQRAEIAMRYEGKVQSRHGVLKNKKTLIDNNSLFYEAVKPKWRQGDTLEQESSKKILIPPEYIGRTSQWVAQLFNLGSKDNYFRVKKIMLHGICELIQAMDDKRVSIKKAYKIAMLSEAMQTTALAEALSPIREITASEKINADEKKVKHLKHSILLRNVLNNKALQTVEQTSGLPLRLFFMGLMSICDKEGKFIYAPHHIKKIILPFTEWDVEQILNALCDCGAIKKAQYQHKQYGYLMAQAL